MSNIEYSWFAKPQEAKAIILPWKMVVVVVAVQEKNGGNSYTCTHTYIAYTRVVVIKGRWHQTGERGGGTQEVPETHGWGPSLSSISCVCSSNHLAVRK